MSSTALDHPFFTMRRFIVVSRLIVITMVVVGMGNRLRQGRGASLAAAGAFMRSWPGTTRADDIR